MKLVERPKENYMAIGRLADAALVRKVPTARMTEGLSGSRCVYTRSEGQRDHAGKGEHPIIILTRKHNLFSYEKSMPSALVDLDGTRGAKLGIV